MKNEFDANGDDVFSFSINIMHYLVSVVVCCWRSRLFLGTCEPVFPVILEFPHYAVSVISFTPISLGLTCMLRVFLYRNGAME